MKIILIFLTFNILIPHILCILKRSNTTLNLLIIKPSDRESYAKSVFDQLNDYRWKKDLKPEIQWEESLVKSAEKEADVISKKNIFDEHEDFEKMKKQVKNKFFTEITLKIDTSGRTPSAELFGLTVLQALLEKYRYYLVEEYNKAGVSVKPFQYNKQAYVVVIHLIKS